MTNLETERVRALKRYNILDTPPDGSFDRITRLAALLFNTPISIVSLVDTDRIWFKSRYGLDIHQIERTPGLCASAILSDDLHQVEDAYKDPRTLSNPLVAGMLRLRFYASVPLKNKDGYNLGTLCIMDKEPRVLSKLEEKILKELGLIVMDEIELRLEARTAVKQRNQLLNIAIHHMKGPLTTIPLRADFIKQEKGDPEIVDELCDKIKSSAKKMTHSMNELMESTNIKLDDIHLNFTRVDFAAATEEVVKRMQQKAASKSQKLDLKILNRPHGQANKTKIMEVVEILIGNAIESSPKNSTQVVTVKELNHKAIIEVIDNGKGFTDEEIKNLFLNLNQLNPQSTGEDKVKRLRLPNVNKTIEAHNGSLWADSEGKGLGSRFVVEIPLID